MGNYENLGKYKISNEDSNIEIENSIKTYKIFKASNGLKSGLLLSIASDKKLYDNNLKEYHSQLEKIKTIQKGVKNLINLTNYSYSKKEDYALFFYECKEIKNYQSIEEYIDGIEPYYFSCKDIKKIMIQMNLLLSFIYENKLSIPFLSPKEVFIDKNNNKEIKFLYISPYLEIFSKKQYNFYKKVYSVLPKKVKSYFPKSKYLNWNIGLFIYLILFRDTPNYQIKIKHFYKQESVYHTIDIKDYRIPDKNICLFDLLHFLLDIEVTNQKNENIDEDKLEEELFKQYLNHPFFTETFSTDFATVIIDKPKNYTLRKIKKKSISDIIEKVDKKKYITMNDLKKKSKKYENYQLLFYNNSLFAIYNKVLIRVYNYDNVLLYDDTREVKFQNNIVFEFEEGVLFFNLKNETYIYYCYIFKKDYLIIKKIKFPVIGDDNALLNGTKKYKFKYLQNFVTSSNKLLIKKEKTHNSEHKNSILIYNLDNLITGKNNYNIDFIGIIDFELFSEKKKIQENNITNEFICGFYKYVHFYGSESYDLKFKLYLGDYNESILKISSDIFVLNQNKYFYILKNHNIIYTFNSYHGNYKLKNLALINDKFLLCNVFYDLYSYYLYDPLSSYPKYGKVITDEEKNSFDFKIKLFEMNNDYVIEHNLDYSNQKDIFYTFKDNIVRKKGTLGKYKYFVLEEKKE